MANIVLGMCLRLLTAVRVLVGSTLTIAAFLLNVTLLMIAFLCTFFNVSITFYCLSFRSRVPNLFKFSYHLGTPYCQATTSSRTTNLIES